MNTLYTFFTFLADEAIAPVTGSSPTGGGEPEAVKSQLSNRINFLEGIIPGQNITDLITNVIEYAFDLVGIVAVAMLVYGGFIYITSAGDEQKAKQGQSIITYAVIGIIITLGALVIVRTVRSAIGG